MPAGPTATRRLAGRRLAVLPSALAVAFCVALLGSAAASEGLPLTGQAVNDATFAKTVRTAEGATVESKSIGRALLVKLQVLLDRRSFSVGVIDGLPGDKVTEAVRALEFAESLKPDGLVDEDVWATLAAESIRPALVDYEITEADVAGPYLESVPEDVGALSKLKSVAYTGPLEMLAERFHMAEELLVELNPGKDFAEAGTVVVVADPGEPLAEPGVESLEIDGAAGRVRAFDGEGALVAAYPASVGSPAAPAPRGSHKVRTVALDPAYTHVSSSGDEKLHVPPGPNGPVGSAWIDLTLEGCGLHGTAEPAALDREPVQGCVRLTNWDARELAHLVREGTKVVFLEAGEAPDDPASATGSSEEAAAQ
ncbi:MAG: L,D-transpeptidase [Tistlia sp.]|uniref:L,D-transpeptidase family protein n=1 Tax=Tistlia sp. TaxID=3057121 RepID=UPI0034A36A28